MVSSDSISACPPVKEYSREFQERLADEIKAAPLDAVWPEVVMDCATWRGLVFKPIGEQAIFFQTTKEGKFELLFLKAPACSLTTLQSGRIAIPL